MYMYFFYFVSSINELALGFEVCLSPHIQQFLTDDCKYIDGEPHHFHRGREKIDLVNDTFTYTFLFVFAVTFAKTSSVRYIAFRTQSWMIKQTRGSSCSPGNV